MNLPHQAGTAAKAPGVCHKGNVGALGEGVSCHTPASDSVACTADAACVGVGATPECGSQCSGAGHHEEETSGDHSGEDANAGFSSDDLGFTDNIILDAPLLEPMLPPGGPWETRGLEFFSSFDSGNCAGVHLSPPRVNVADSQQEEQRAPDVVWAAADADINDFKILYEVIQARCPVHIEPDATSKVVTKKSKGSRFFACSRMTLNGWQKLIGEKGWVCLYGVNTTVVEESAVGAIAVLASGTKCEVAREIEPSSPMVKIYQPEVDKPATAELVVPELEEPLQSDDAPMSFDVLVRADCEGTPFERIDRQWFYFGVRGDIEPNQKLRFRVLGLSRFNHVESAGKKQRRLLTDGLQPVFRSSVSSPSWQFVSGECGVEEMLDGSLAFTFNHALRKGLKKAEELFFALTYPYPLTRIYEHLDGIGRRLVSNGAYVHREHIADSLAGRRIELFTITERSGRSMNRQPLLEGFPSRGKRPRLFPGRRSVFISARVHPGETPASYLLEGLLDFLASGSASAQELLRRFVFHVVPVLNPDGVACGHHRMDLRGENLNRVYGSANFDEHPSICAAEAVCSAAHKHQGGIALYLDLHAHSNRRGAFILGDAEACGNGALATSMLFGYALARRCATFEFSQSDFVHAAPGTGKSAMGKMMGVPLCFTVEANYVRGHHSSALFQPPLWRRIGCSCLEAFLDLELIKSPGLDACLSDIQVVARHDLLSELQLAAAWLSSQAPEFLECLHDMSNPSRACPHFGSIRGPSEDHKPSRLVWTNPELVGQTVEIIERSGTQDDGRPCRLLLHDCDGGFWIPENDLEYVDAQRGRFFYGVLSKAGVAHEPDPTATIGRYLYPGVVLEAAERRVVDGVLRIHFVADSKRGMTAGWVSEYSSALFDPRLGGVAQLMRLRGPPTNLGRKGTHYAFAC